MSGILVHDPGPSHHCEPPCGIVRFTGDGRRLEPEPGGQFPMDPPLYPRGAVWLCDCGSAWKVAEPLPVKGQRRVGNEWQQFGRLASWRWRRRARNALRSSA